MIIHYPFESLGKAEHGWLKSSHHFSFAHYYNSNRMEFGTLRVVNDDWVKPGTGFSAHPHNNMEIISYIRSGQILHKDSQGNQGITKAGEVQVMSAGTGVVHSEYNSSDQPLSFYQIWITPKQLNIKPRWQAKTFPTALNSTQLPLLVSGFEEDAKQALWINQDARIYGGRVAAGAEFQHNINNQAYVLASDGRFEISSKKQSINMSKGDGAEVTDLDEIKITASQDSEILIIDVPAS